MLRSLLNEADVFSFLYFAYVYVYQLCPLSSQHYRPLPLLASNYELSMNNRHINIQVNIICVLKFLVIL